MKPLPMSTIRTGGNQPTRDKLSRSSHQVRSEPTSRQSNSLRSGPPSMKSSTPSRTNHGSDVRDPSSMTLASRSRKVLLLPLRKGHKTIHCQSLRKYLEELIRLGFLKEYVLTPEAASRSRQPSAPPPTQPQPAITQCKAIE